ncbi:MAG: 2-oxo acid dehydrogenase subunit E2 [Chloroflexi bacterium]|nr:MAG: 2-oxo acid dehydrogenase subunit E2 [Chloroflexota bacterium]
MAEFIKMPTLGFDMEEGTMGTWLKNVGDPVKKGDVLAEIESDKVTQELQARAEGVLLVHLANPGDLIPVGASLGIIGADGEDVAAMVAEAGGAGPAPAAEEAPTNGAAPVAEVKEVVAETAVSAPTSADDIKATPIARRIAKENGINLAQVTGTGPGGRIRKADVEAAISQPKPTAAPAPVAAPTAPAPAPVAPAPIPAGPEQTEVPLTRMRSAIARRMAESKTTVPHFYVTSEIAMDDLFALRKQINAKLDPEEKITVNDLVVKAAALALREFPNINAAFGGDKIIQNNRISVGSAVAVPGGLLTIVQQDTDISSISKIARDHKAMIGRARDGKVQPDDIQGATFTVSNLGPFDVENFVAIINPPHAAILAVGSANKVPVVVGDELAVGLRMKATLSADHRVTDGAEAAQYMQLFKAILEEPLRLLL